ncbi:DUF1642 domain-containing protein [Lactococcus lactis]|uniref:DUF1642 domain-containing protein n=1 Tax=Lactococcus lactis TaxID=1358 RepID=UPI001BAA4734|nr:DUF1642 domain-containing protein [Lactococcus lactis]MBR8679394.1 DUF1642 domain-containing protein [Lactococcus lactis subsp. lactis]MBR8681754.1 DUF1642 domain-containing protein [Lactococcus lactis subsp. lactis]MBR8686878.1 DUF1642 domain-containing protein [Lactococcus lactis subsp. lactis]
MTKFEEELSSLPVSKSTNYTEYWNKAQLLTVFKDWQPQQALPVVPEDVAKLPPFDDMKEYVLDERLLTIREYLNKLDDKSNSDITEAEAWCMIHEDIAYRAMLDGYTVEKPQLFYLKHIDMSKSDAHLNWYLAKGTDNVLIHQGIKKGKLPKLKCILKLTQQEIDSMETGSYELVPVEDGE